MLKAGNKILEKEIPTLFLARKESETVTTRAPLHRGLNLDGNVCKSRELPST